LSTKVIIGSLYQAASFAQLEQSIQPLMRKATNFEKVVKHAISASILHYA